MYCNEPQNATNTNNTNTVEALTAVSCSLSILGACVIFLSYIVIPEIRNQTRKLVTWLTLADLLQPFGYLSAIVVEKVGHATSGDVNNQFCTLQSAVTSYASLVSFFLTTAIALHLFRAVNKRGCISNRAFIISANIVSWGIPAVIIYVALSENMLGREQDDSQTFGTGPWCWVKCDSGKTSKSLLYMLLTGKAFEIQCYIYTATLYCLLKWKMYIARRFRSLNEINPDLRDDDKNFLFVWLMLLSIRIWGTIRFLMRAIPEDYSKVSPNMAAVDNVFVYMQAAGDPAQAFCNFILFCLLDNEVRVKLKRFVFCRAPLYENFEAQR